jgi:hypothetical protein
MIITVPIVMKHMLAQQLVVKNFYTEVHKILTTVLVADTRSWTDGRTWSPHKALAAPSLFVIALPRKHIITSSVFKSGARF